MESDILTQIDSYLRTCNSPEDNSLQHLKEITAFVNDNLDICRILFNNNVDPAFPEKLFNLPSIKQLISQLMAEYGEDRSAYVYSFVVNGGYSIIKYWMNKENRETPDEIAALINITIMKLFRDYP